jgi:hypothetical protein
MLLQVDRTLQRKDESRKHVERRLCGIAMSDLSKTSRVCIKSFISVYYIYIYIYIYSDGIALFLLITIPALLNFHLEHCI